MIFQALIVGSVMVHNVHNQWTPNPYLAAAIGMVLAFLATVLVARLLQAASTCNQRLQGHRLRWRQARKKTTTL